MPIKSNDRALFSKGFRLVAYFLIHPFYPNHFTWIMQKAFLTFLTPQLTWDKKRYVLTTSCISSQFQTPERNPLISKDLVEKKGTFRVHYNFFSSSDTGMIKQVKGAF